jgi:hypothetical protein
VWTKNVSEIVHLIEAMAKEKSGRLYNTIELRVNRTDLNEIDRKHFLNEINSWGKNIVWTEDYVKAIASVVKVWGDKTKSASREAEKNIRELKLPANKEYLSELLYEAKTAVGLSPIVLDEKYFEKEIITYTGQGKSVSIELSKDTVNRTIILKGKFEDIYIYAPKGTVILEDAKVENLCLLENAGHTLLMRGSTTVDTLVVEGKDIYINIGEDSIVNNMDAATAVEVEGTGVLGNITGSASKEVKNNVSASVEAIAKPVVQEAGTGMGNAGIGGGGAGSGGNGSDNTEGESYDNTDYNEEEGQITIPSITAINRISKLGVVEIVATGTNEIKLQAVIAPMVTVSFKHGTANTYVVTIPDAEYDTNYILTFGSGFTIGSDVNNIINWAKPLRLSWEDPSGHKAMGEGTNVVINLKPVDNVGAINNIGINMECKKEIGGKDYVASSGDVDITFNDKVIFLNNDDLYHIIGSLSVDSPTDININIKFKSDGYYKLQIYAIDEN